jgi:hypothetical protein
VTHPTELALAMLADDALEAHDTAEVELHVAACDRCGARVAALREESRALAAVLAYDPASVSVPEFVKPASVRAMVTGSVVVLLIAALFSTARSLIDVSVPDAVKWFNPFNAGGAVNLLVRTGTFLLSDRGSQLASSIVETLGGIVIMLLLLWVASVLGRRIRGPMMMACVACAFALHPSQSEAVEIRHEHEGSVLIPADETIDDTLIALGDTVEVNGNVSGDLIAFGRRVIVRGNVAGLVITGGESVTLDGSVDGSVLAGAETLTVSSRRIGRNLFGGGESVNVTDTSNIEQNVLVGGEKVTLAGRVGHDVLGGGEELEVASTIGGALTTYSKRMTLLAPAHVAGDVHAHGVEKKDHVVVSPGAVIGGQLITELDKMDIDKNRYLTAHFYGWELVWLAAAFVAGFALLWVVPALQRVPFDGVGDALRSGGYGMLALVATPIIAVLACITVIGIPVGAIALMAWCAGVYLAKVVVAQLIGSRLLDAVAEREEHFAVSLLVGLLILTFVSNLPFVGGLIGFVVTVVGLGLLVLFVHDVIFDGEPIESV